MDFDVDGVDQAVSTGHLPDWNDVESLVEAAYRRSDLLEKRRKMMEAWGKYCGGAGGKVLSLSRRMTAL